MRGLTIVEKREIENKANETLTKFNMDQDSFVDILELGKQMGFIVGNARLSDDEDGFIISNPNVEEIMGFKTNKIIGVNSNRNFYLKRFIIAHELGHYLFIKDNNSIFAHRENKLGKSDEENEFDYFAACLLMPEGKFKEVFNNLKIEYSDDNLIKAISDKFQVPFESVKRRINELDLKAE